MKFDNLLNLIVILFLSLSNITTILNIYINCIFLLYYYYPNIIQFNNINNNNNNNNNNNLNKIGRAHV